MENICLFPSVKLEKKVNHGVDHVAPESDNPRRRSGLDRRDKIQGLLLLHYPFRVCFLFHP